MARKISSREAEKIKDAFIREFGLDNEELGVAVGLSCGGGVFCLEVRKTKRLPRGSKFPKEYKGLRVNVKFVGRIVAGGTSGT